MFCVLSISLILFEIGVPNLVCGCILGWWSVTCYLQSTVTLTSDLVLRISCLEHIDDNFYSRNPKFCVWIPLGMAECCLQFLVTLTLTLTSDLISRLFLHLEQISFVTNNLPQMCLMLDKFLWGIRHVTVTFLVFLNFIYRHSELIVKYNICLKTLYQNQYFMAI